jgi:hypothetical protein
MNKYLAKLRSLNAEDRPALGTFKTLKSDLPSGFEGVDGVDGVEPSAADMLLRSADAEAQAFEVRIVQWLNRNPAPSRPGRCTLCGEPESPSAVVLPFGTEPGTHAWLHAECWLTWSEARRADAIAALAKIGIQAPTSSGHANGEQQGERNGHG